MFYDKKRNKFRFSLGISNGVLWHSVSFSFPNQIVHWLLSLQQAELHPLTIFDV